MPKGLTKVKPLTLVSACIRCGSVACTIAGGVNCRHTGLPRAAEAIQSKEGE